jgi:hypothetical protein
VAAGALKLSRRYGGQTVLLVTGNIKHLPEVAFRDTLGRCADHEVASRLLRSAVQRIRRCRVDRRRLPNMRARTAQRRSKRVAVAAMPASRCSPRAGPGHELSLTSGRFRSACSPPVHASFVVSPGAFSTCRAAARSAIQRHKAKAKLMDPQKLSIGIVVVKHQYFGRQDARAHKEASTPNRRQRCAALIACYRRLQSTP